MKEVWNRIEELANLVKNEYYSTSIINSKKRILTPTHDDINAEYVQFAYKFVIPLWVFKGSADNTSIAHYYVDGLICSEVKYLIEKLEESQKSRQIYSINNIDPEELANHFLSITNVTDLFVPSKIICTKQFCSIRDIIDCRNLRIHWSTSSVPFDKIFVLNKSGVTWSQKKVKDMTVPREKDPEGLTHLTNEDEILQISAKINDDDSILFLIRLVAGTAIEPNKVRMINISKNLFEKL